MNNIIDGRFLSPLDILLHHSGHIMLSDFDLAKHSGVIGGRPATIHQSELNGVIIDTFILYGLRILIFFLPISSLLLTQNHAQLISGPIHL